MSATAVAVLYVIFALFGTAANLGAQMATLWVYAGPYAVEISILVGTAIAFPLKYVLEKRYIFRFKADNLAHDGRLFLLYAWFSVFTTLVFWGTEYAFHLVFGTDTMRYLGGALGLAIGYALKYRLDKRFVFVSSPPTEPRAC